MAASDHLHPVQFASNRVTVLSNPSPEPDMTPKPIGPGLMASSQSSLIASSESHP